MAGTKYFEVPCTFLETVTNSTDLSTARLRAHFLQALQSGIIIRFSIPRLDITGTAPVKRKSANTCSCIPPPRARPVTIAEATTPLVESRQAAQSPCCGEHRTDLFHSALREPLEGTNCTRGSWGGHPVHFRIVAEASLEQSG